MRHRLHVLAVAAGALVLLVGIPAGTLWVLGHLHASSAGYLGGIVVGLGLMAALMVGLQRFAPDPFVLEVSLVFAFCAGLGFVAWLALRGR